MSDIFEPVGTPTDVNATTDQRQSQPAITALEGGGYVVVWTSFIDEMRREDVVAQVYDAGGTPVGGEILVNDVTDGQQLARDVTALPNGGFTVSYDSFGLDGSLFAAAGRTFDAGGAPGAEFVFNQTTSGSQSGAELDTLSSGNIVSVWNGGSVVRITDASGNGGDEKMVDLQSNAAIQSADVAARGDGGFTLAYSRWTSTGDVSSVSDVIVQRFDSAANPVSDEIVANTTLAGSQYVPSIAALSTGGYVVVWYSDANATLDGVENTGVVGQVFTASGIPVGDELQINQASTGAGAVSPVVVALDDGGFVVSWDNPGAGSNGQVVVPDGIYLRIFDADGTPRGDEALIGGGIGDDGADTVIQVSRTPIPFAALPDGDVVTVWETVEQSIAQLRATQVEDTGPTDGNDPLEGTVGDDTIAGQDGNDTLQGGDGSDLLSGDAGNDVISGQNDDDSISGGTGNDTLAGASGADLVQGDDGNDNMGGGPGNDTLEGGAGADFMGGGLGNDLMDGGADDDVVNGGPGDDTLIGGAGNDTMGGSFGNDSIEGNAGDDDLGGGSGSDTISGGDGNDSVGGGEGNDEIDGGDGDDFLAGGGRDDSIDGGSGDDLINAGDGDDTMEGGEGADLFIFNGFRDGDADVITDFEDGVDRFRMTGVENAPGTGNAGRVTALNITDTEFGAEINYLGHTVLITGVTAAELGTEDFIFL